MKMNLPNARGKSRLGVFLQAAGVIRVALLVLARFLNQAERGRDVRLAVLDQKDAEPPEQIPVWEAPPVDDRQVPLAGDLEVPDVQPHRQGK